jgi:hypothetical protein
MLYLLQGTNVSVTRVVIVQELMLIIYSNCERDTNVSGYKWYEILHRYQQDR